MTEHLPSRAETEGRRVVEAAVLAALFMASNLPPDEADDHQGIFEAVEYALDEAGYEDQEALQATAMCRFLNHDPETRGPRNGEHP